MGKSSELRTSRAPARPRTLLSNSFFDAVSLRHYGSEARGDSSPRSARPVAVPWPGRRGAATASIGPVLPNARKSRPARPLLGGHPTPTERARELLRARPRAPPAGRSPDDPRRTYGFPRANGLDQQSRAVFRGPLSRHFRSLRAWLFWALMSTPEIQFAALTDVGECESINEDNFLVDKKLGCCGVRRNGRTCSGEWPVRWPCARCTRDQERSRPDSGLRQGEPRARPKSAARHPEHAGVPR